MAALARAVLEIDYQAPVGVAFAGEDESAYLRRFSISRGRGDELDAVQAATAEITLDNRTGRFDPVNASGPHYPNVKPRRRARISVDVDSGTSAFTARRSSFRGTDVIRGGTATIPLFTGFVESWAQSFEGSNADAVTTLRCVDAFGILNLFDFEWGFRYTGTYPNETMICGQGSGNVVPDAGPPYVPDDLTGARIHRVLDCIGWPAGERVIDAGTRTVLGSISGQNVHTSSGALAHLHACADLEGGWIYVDGLGQIRFVDAAHLPVLDPLDVYGDVTGEQRFAELEAPVDAERLWNELVVTTTHESLTGKATVDDPASVDEFYPSSRSVTLPPAGFDTLLERGAALLLRYRAPALRFPTLEIAPKSAVMLRLALARSLAEKIRVRRRPAGADQIERDSRIEGIKIASSSGFAWSISWSLSSFAEELLTWPQVSSSTGWAAETNATISGSGAALWGGSALRITSVAAGDMTARTSPDDQITVEPGKIYRATAYLKAAASSRSARVEISWRDSSGSEISSSAGSSVTDQTLEWTFAEVRGTAPASAAYATVRIKILGTGAASESHDADFVTLARD